MIKRLAPSFIMVVGALFLSACAKPGPILLQLQYQQPKEVSAGKGKTVVGISPFKDDRGDGASVVGRRTVAATDEMDELVIQGTAADTVASSLRAALKARGIAQKDTAAWDLTDAHIPEGTDLVISGEINKLWVNAESHFAKTTVRADVQIRVSVADTAQKKIIRVVNVASAAERESIFFSTSMTEETITEALSSALDQIFKDEELRKRFQ